MKPKAAADAIEDGLRRLATHERATVEKRYLKSDLEFLGASVPAIDATIKAFVAEHGILPRAELLALVTALWEQPVHERRMAAVSLLSRHVGILEPADLPFLERLLRESRTWALVDGLAGDVVARMLLGHPEIASELDRWSTDADFWLRRSALLAHLRRIRGGGELGDVARYADAMLDEREFFVRKAIGWVLREAGKRRPDEVVAWLEPRVGRASGVTLREAVKYLPERDRDWLLAAGRAARRRGAPTS